MEVSINPKRSPARTAFTVGAIAAAMAGGYMLRGPVGNAQQGAATQIARTPVVETPATRDAASMQKAFAEVARVVAPAVVTITTETKARPTASRRPRVQPFGGPGGGPGGAPGGGEDPFEEFFKQFRNFGFTPNAYQKEQMRARFYEVQDRGGGLGSGMIYRADGYILTNAHVVRGADTVSVKLNDEREFKKAKVLGIDDRTDVAVVKIDATNLPYVKLGDSSQVEVGDWAIAIGNPFGLEHSVTVGVISAKAREVPLDRRSPGDYLQTDASINPGNSGGPLVDIYGRVIGVNNAIYSQSGGNIGIGFAVPINTAREIADQLVKSGKIRRGYLGIQISNVADNAAAFGLDPTLKGVLVQGVDPDTPGSRAGLQPGDVIQSFNGTAVTRSTELQRLVGNAPVGSTAELKVLRDGKVITLTTKLDELKDGEGGATRPGQPGGDEEGATPDALGLQVRPLTPELANSMGLKQTKGLVVMNVEDGSAAEAGGIQRGDVIERIGQAPVTTVAEMRAAIQKILGQQTGEDKSVALYINRNGTRSYVIVKVEK